jgi:hypothetical protein
MTKWFSCIRPICSRKLGLVNNIQSFGLQRRKSLKYQSNKNGLLISTRFRYNQAHFVGTKGNGAWITL